MTLISLENISAGFGSHDLFSDVNLQIDSSGRYALVGRNGVGKTTLASIISGTASPGSGTLVRQPGTRVSVVPQLPEYREDLIIRDALLEPWSDLRDRMRRTEIELSESGESNLESALAAYQRVRDEWDAVDGDHLESRGCAVLESLGLPGPYDRPVSTLSGGELGLLALASAVSSEPQLLILDEPGNHLDFRGLAWLESYLGRFRGALLIISHNRYLMDRLCETVLELRDGGVEEFSGNYSDFRLNRLRQRAADQADRKAKEKHVERLEELVHKFEQIARRVADPAWGKRLRARRTQLKLARAEMGDAPTADRSIEVRFHRETNRADIALRVRNYSRSFGSRILFDSASAEISNGEKVALIGPNGCGKSTLVADLLTGGGWDTGSEALRIGPSFRVGHMTQNFQPSSPEESLENFVRGWGHLSRDEAFDRLSPLGFAWEDLGKRMDALSGGELARVQLARLYHDQANLLILDEPTNHLDAYSREAVEDALTDFPGTILVVSHDRYFLDKVVDRVLEVRDGKLVSHPGGFSDWWADRGRIRSDGRISTRAGERKRQPVSGAGERRIKEIEKRIEILESEKLQLEADMEQAWSSGDAATGRWLGKKLNGVNGRLDGLWGEWEKLES